MPQTGTCARRAFSPCRRFRSTPVSNTVFEDRNLGRNAPDLFVPERQQLLLTVGERLRDIVGYYAADIMGFCGFFHPRRDVDRAAVNPDRPLASPCSLGPPAGTVHQGCACLRPKFEFATDSLLEGTGFEPSVPRDGRQMFDNKPEIPDLVCQIVNCTKSSTVLQAIM